MGEKGIGVQRRPAIPCPSRRAYAIFGNETVLAHYSMALKEHGNSIGKEVLYDIRPSVLRPSMFRALVDVNGSRYEGEARTKREAKHLASRAACRAMKIAT